jgi:outer membrane immunogenic protein
MPHRAVGEVTLKRGQVARGFPMKWAAVVGGMALACAASVSSRAADLTPVPYKASSYIPAYYNWTGYYLGVAMGDGFGTIKFSDPFDGLTSSFSTNSFLFGGYTGVNYQVGSIVAGGEFDFTGSWARGSTVDTFGDTLTTKIFWTSALTARLGWAFDRLLVFVKGGAAFVYHRDSISGPGPHAAPSGSAVDATWTLGGGVDWAITEHWIARGEYDYMNLPTRAETVSAPAGTVQVGGHFNELKAGIAYKF